MVIPESREVSDPRIISPSSVTLWLTGTNVTVTWDTSNIPSDFDTKGKLVLGYLDGVDENEHLDIENPLADGFSLIRGYIDVLVPQVDPGSDYIVVLFGDSGNRSSTFTIL
ncbi:hypothetical protein JAAARDRAFT_122290 [Jaapia argillacea MUCL 33604]|uniref:Fibronectin type-III domain-containing protein n=1 Tax=Jaapia argillacea MUCL 33604 TaxID=933084 RepID=A0A067Q6D6_9AGAM|nr:hypothetical protein JAAARDRAFT_122290 [Jaapia argillacea MUCL 33604]